MHVNAQGSKKLEFQLTLKTSYFQIFIALGKIWFALLMIYLGEELPDPLRIWQVRMKGYLPRRKIFLSATMGQSFLQAPRAVEPLLLTGVNGGINAW